jgi:hypothetical protein
MFFDRIKEITKLGEIGATLRNSVLEPASALMFTNPSPLAVHPASGRPNLRKQLTEVPQFQVEQSSKASVDLKSSTVFLASDSTSSHHKSHHSKTGSFSRNHPVIYA